MTSLDRLRQILGRAGERDAPEVDADFADRLEERLRLLAGGPVPKGGTGLRAARRPPWLAAGAIAVAAAAVLALVITQDDGGTSRVNTLEPITTSTLPDEATTTTSSTTTSAPTTSTVPSTTTTIVVPAAVTTTTVRPATTTTASLPATTTSTSTPSTSTTSTTSTTGPVRPTTTTTTQPGQPQNLAMTCQVTPGPSVTCRWAQSASADFSNYRVIRKVNGTETTVLETGDRSVQQAIDNNPLVGTTVQYGVLARDRTAKLLGQGGPVSLTCC